MLKIIIKKYKNVSLNLIIDSSIVIILFVLYSIMLTIYKNKSKKKVLLLSVFVLIFKYILQLLFKCKLGKISLNRLSGVSANKTTFQIGYRQSIVIINALLF